MNRIGRVIIRVNFEEMPPIVGLANDTRDRVFRKMFAHSAANACAFLEDWDDVPEVEVIEADTQERVRAPGECITAVELVPGLEFRPADAMEQRQMIQSLGALAVGIINHLTQITAMKLARKRQQNGSGVIRLPGRS